MYHTLLFLHVLSAFAMVAALGLFWAVYFADGGPLLRLTTLAFALWGAASLLVLVFGIWLALHVSGYGLGDFWISGAIVLWLIAGAFGGRMSSGYRKMAVGGPRPELLVHVVTTIAVVLLLIDMIWKPGA